MIFRVVRELEHMLYEETQIEWGMFSQKRQFQRDQVSACQYLQDHEEDEAELCTVA